MRERTNERINKIDQTKPQTTIKTGDKHADGFIFKPTAILISPFKFEII